jgi:isoamylase
MDDGAWNADSIRSLGMLLSGNAIEEMDERGELIVGDSLLVLINADPEAIPFTMPELDADHQWQRIFDTADPQGSEPRLTASHYPLESRSLAVFKVTPPLRERRKSADAETPEDVAAEMDSVPLESPEAAVPVGVED